MFKGRTFNRNTAKDYRQQPRSGVRIQPTAQAVGGTWKTAEPQRREILVMTKSLPRQVKIALLVFGLSWSLPLLQAQPPDLPPGPAQFKVRTACLECHDASIIVQQRLSKPAWTREVDKMIKWGALVDPADRDAFIDYLSTNFPPDKPPAEMPRSAKK
jgi:hypothetical protein